MRSLWPRRLDLRRVVTHDFPMKAAAVLIAVLFWISNAQNAAPREIAVAFDGRVPIERPTIPTGFVLRGQLGDVGVTLRGPEGVVDRMALGDLHATLDLTGVDPARPEPQNAKVVVTAANDAVKVVDVSPATIAIRLERITSRAIAVQTKFANDPPKGAQAATPAVSPKEVRISGPESMVGQIAAAFVTVRFGDAFLDLVASAPVVAVDANGATVDGVQVEPAAVVVNVALLPTATTRTLPVLWTLRGNVANGYWISRVMTDPVSVTVRGDQSALAALDRIETAAVDVTGLNTSRNFVASLILPDGVSLLQPTGASVAVTVVPLAGTRPFSEAVQIVNLGPGLAAETDPGTVSIVVAGPAPALAAFASDQVVANVDANRLGPGTYTIDVVVRVPTGTTVQSVQPVRVTLTIRSK